MKMQNSVNFLKENLKMIMLKIRNIVKLHTIVFIQGNIETLHIAYLI